MPHVDSNLPRSLFGWYSQRLGLEMPIVEYGYAGHPLLIFPTAQADYLENERFDLIRSIEPLIFAGRIRVFSIDSINRFAWMNEAVPPHEAARRTALYNEYVEEEVVPHIRRRVGDGGARLAVTGASFGAFHAANMLFRRPELFDTLIAMSGFYDLEPGYTQGYRGDDLYFNNPVSYIANWDHDRVELVRRACDIHIVTGQGAYEAPHRARQLSDLLWTKGIWHDLDVWGHDVNHDWPWWRTMLPTLLADRCRYI